MADFGKVPQVKKPLKIQDDLYVIDMEQPDDRVLPAPAVLVDADEMILIGIGNKTDVPAIAAQIRQILPLEKLKYIIVPSEEKNLLSTLIAFELEGAVPTILVEGKFAKMINLAAFRLPVIPISETNDRLILKSGRVLSFILSPFLISPGAFLVHDARQKTLFSNFLFETAGKMPFQTPETDRLERMLSFCQTFVPSTDFLRPVLNRIAKLPIETAITQSGTVHDRGSFRFFCSGLASFEFYNSRAYVSKTGDNLREFNYEGLCNQVLHKLKSIYGAKAVLEGCASESYRLDPETLEITPLAEKGPQLWNKLFETIYAKKGTAWIAVLEPLVIKLSDLLGAEKPLIYHSAIAETEYKIRQLDTENTVLADRVVNLESHLKETMEKLIKDPFTHHYNEMFLREYLTSEIGKLSWPLSENRNFSLFYLQVDNIQAINTKYSVKTGDETIRNLGYLLEQVADENDLLVKRNGPGFIVLVQNQLGRVPMAFARKMQTTAKDSELFIEPVSLSVAIVRLSEFEKTVNKAQVADGMMALGESRIRAVRGSGLLIDENTKIEKSKTGQILIADSEEVNLKLLQSLFFNENYGVITCKDGITALEAAKTTPFDAIIVERNAAKLDGMMIKQQLGESPLNAKTLFILLTYNKNPDIVTHANQLGIDYVIQKPVIFEEIAGLIERTMKKGGTR